MWLRFEIQVSAIRVDYFEPRKRFWRNSFSLQSAPQTVLRYGTKTDVLWSEIFRVVTSQTKNGFFSRQDMFRVVNYHDGIPGVAGGATELA